MRHKPESEGPSANRHVRTLAGQSCLRLLVEGRISSHADKGAVKGTLRGLMRESILPSSMSAISCRIPSRASQNRSISALSSDSVGSIIKVPATGHDIVGAWKPVQQNSSLQSPIKEYAPSVRHHTVILQPLGHVHSLDVCRLLERPHIQNELMSYKTCKGRKGKLNRS